jgi:nucleoside-diphosphate-sugar epimerase
MAVQIPDDVVIFASGESDSQCTDSTRFQREKDLLNTIHDARLVVYFSTISVLQEKHTPYTEHKLAMESMVRRSRHLILRLPNLVGSGQSPFQLIPALVTQVRSGTVTLHRGAARDILDVDDMARMLPLLLKSCENETVNVSTGYYVPVQDIITYIANRLNLSPKIQLVEGTDYPVACTDRLSSIVDVSLFNFGPTYYQQVLDKYVGRQ